MKPSPILTGLKTYPFVRLTDAKRELVARGIDVVDFGIGEPREDTAPFIRDALAAALEPKSTYPLAEGLPELRGAIADWVARRFGPALDPEAEVLPTLGSKEAIFHLAQVVGGDFVAVTAPGYPVAERGAAFAGKQVLELPLGPERGFLPDLDAVDGPTWDRTAILWLNYPNNPTAATAPLELYERAAAIARDHAVGVASDEAYSEIYFGEVPPSSALEVADRRNVIALNTLSKRSSMPGYRSGFVAGDPDVIAALKRYRPNVGVAPPEFIQRAAAAAWRDEAHVEDVRALYRAKRDVLLPVFEAAGIYHAGGDATFFLWLDAGERAGPLAAALLEGGVVLAPGSFFGPAGEGFLRLALVPTLAECERAAELLAEALVVGVQGGVEPGPGA
jgi:acetylornithine aminotransferase